MGAINEYFNFITGVMKENNNFLRENAKGTLDEVIELMNDTIDHVSHQAKRKSSKENYVRSTIAVYIYHLLMPLSYAIYTDLITGNLTACFMEVRLMLESLVKCYIADLKYPNQAFFQEKLELLEKEGKSISKIMRETGREFNLGNRFLALWSKLSQDWSHTKGLVDKLVNVLVEKSDVPTWGLVIPMRYTETDLSTIDELKECVSQFRSLLKTAMGKYQQ